MTFLQVENVATDIRVQAFEVSLALWGIFAMFCFRIILS